MIIKHGIRPDGQKATPEDLERAKAWNRAGRDRATKPAPAAAADPTETSMVLKSCAVKSYKSPEFVPSDNDHSSEANTRKVQSKVELALPKRKKRPREDHAG